ncbi:probable maleylacetoacetate isomerase 2 isoform X1 [Anthonomus grandis grandis]|uniref:probable maleylacetoacetate isomerase 2 isoform X1 n=1 Tax=Anthonomus grandis grandis TaxID=2921223 RepID=UPI0021659172|nr:probable maleylacetoacetate isomerase 2 isoform X1 [Anthonomus grandis grandis]
MATAHTGHGKTILYSYWRSSCSWRVRIALNLKEIPHEIKPISLIKAGGQHHSNDFRDVNPMEQVPAMHIDGVNLIESMSIMHYLEETRPHRPLLPADVVKRAKVREICEVIVSGIQPLQNLCVLIHVGEEKKNEWAKHWINRGFRAVEKLLGASAGKYCVGDEITLADCCLIPQVFNARRFHVDLRPFPIILRIDRELERHPAFIAAHPNNQPDCPQEAQK